MDTREQDELDNYDYHNEQEAERFDHAEVLLTETPYAPVERGLHEDLSFKVRRERQRLKTHLRMLGLSNDEVRGTMAFVDRLIGREVEAEDWAN